MTIASYIGKGWELLVAKGTKAGYRDDMAVQAFCTTCQRMVYFEEGETAVCPVCSSPLLESTESAGDNDEDEDETATENTA